MYKVDIIVPVSGGKDSQACVKLAVRSGKKVMGIFCDTMYEHPMTYDHVSRLKMLYDIGIITLKNGSNPLDESVKNGRFPSDVARFCTDKLKIRETRLFLKEYSEKFGAVEVWYGMRSGESHARRKRYADKTTDMLFTPHEMMPKNYPKYLGKNGVRFRLPILDWSDIEVFDFLEGEHNPLYDKGFSRVGCFPCLAAGDPAKERAFAFDDFGKKQKLNVRIVGKKIGKEIFTSKGGKLRNNERQGCLICSI